jgi:hypothetical protein
METQEMAQMMELLLARMESMMDANHKKMMARMDAWLTDMKNI